MHAASYSTLFGVTGELSLPFCLGDGDMYSSAKPKGNTLPHQLNDIPLRHPFKSWHRTSPEENDTLDLASTKMPLNKRSAARLSILLTLTVCALNVNWHLQKKQAYVIEPRSTNLSDSKLYSTHSHLSSNFSPWLHTIPTCCFLCRRLEKFSLFGLAEQEQFQGMGCRLMSSSLTQPNI